MTDNANANNDDQVVEVVEEEPVVDVYQDGQGSGSSATNNNTKYITIAISVAVSVLIYFLVFSGGSDSDVVDPNQIVTDSKATSQARSTIDDINSVIGINYDDTGLAVDTVNQDLLKLPELPELPEDVTQDIEQQIEDVRREEVGEDTFTSEEVNEMINLRLKSFEDEMNKIRDESERLAKELEERKAEEERQKKEKKFAPFLGSSTDPNGAVPPGSGTPSTAAGGTTPSGAAGSLPPNVAGDTLQSLEDQKAEEERQLLIAQRKRVMQERKGSPMFKMQGGGGGDGSTIESDSIIITDKDSLKNVEEAQTEVVTSKTADLSRTITQGKVIPAILESAIDTDVQNQVRAVVSRDVYADMGKNILIPKGSRVIGTYQTVSSTTIARLDIVWSRIIRADGLSITLNANTADSLGRGGVPGDLDNKYTQIIKNAFLSSVVTIASAALVDKITDTVTTTTTSGTETTTTSNATNQALIDATTDFGDEMQTMVDDLKEENPTIRIAQGTKLNIVVNQDLVLPIYKQKKR